MSNDFQKRLWEHLQLRLPEGSSLSEAISETLSLGKDAAYRRLRGETALTANELLRLAERYALSLDELYAQQRDLVPFRRYHFIRDLDDYRRYLEGSLKQLEEIASTAGHWFYYQAKDIPVYYQFAFPHLAAFKIYVWLKSVYNLDRINGTYYSLGDIPRDILALAQKQWQVFSRINTSEFWNDTTVLSLINQLAYYYEAGLLRSREEALAICDDFQAMMKVIYRQALNQKRVQAQDHQSFSAAEYRMYYHEILLMDNHILARLGPDNHRYYLPYGGLNFLSTADHSLGRDMQSYLDMQAQKSSLLSEVSEKERNKFFIRIKNRIERLRETIRNTDPFM